MSEIANKAGGVLLWVALMLKTLQEGCRNKDRLKDLLRKIDNIPPYYFLESLRNATLQAQNTNLEAELYQTIANVEPNFLAETKLEAVVLVFYIAASVGLWDYVSWVLENDFAVSDDRTRFWRVFSVVVKDAAFGYDQAEALLVVLRFLKQGSPR